MGFATGVPDVAAAGVPTAPGLAVVSGTATVACAPGDGGADTAGVGAAGGSATVKVVVLVSRSVVPILASDFTV